MTVTRSQFVHAIARTLLAGAAAACSGESAKTPTAPAPPVPVATITVMPPAVTMAAGATQQLTAAMLDANGNTLAGQTVAWTSGNAAVAAVSAAGLVTSFCFGNADVRATSAGVATTVPVVVVQPPTVLMYDVASDVPCNDLAAIRQGVSKAQSFLTTVVGGDIPAIVQSNVVVRLAATGLGDPSAPGICCSFGSLTAAATRLFFDVKHVQWDIPRAPGNWTVFANKEKVAAHEYTHAWAWSLGGLRLGAWLNEGLAEYIAYSTMIRLGQMQASDVDAFMLSAAVGTGEAAKCLASLETGSLWPGHIGFIAVEALVNRSANGILSLRVANQDIGAGMTLDQAFAHAFGLSKADFYNSFPAYLAGIGGPGKCT